MDTRQPAHASGIPTPFQSRLLSHAIIALPLQEQITQELALTASVGKKHPDLRDTHNSAVFLNPAFDGGPKMALQAVRDLLPKAVERTGSRATISIDEPDPGISDRVALASLDGPVIRQLRGLDAALHAPTAAIERIWPTRFEVIIDINLNFKPLEAAGRRSRSARVEIEHPDPRRVAKLLIRKYIEQAKRSLRVIDDDQVIEDYKTDISNQHVFARLEGSVIRKLVEIDQREAEKMARKAEQTKEETGIQAMGRESKAAKAAIKAAPPADVERFRTIHHIWPDFELGTCINRSIRTVKVDAARSSFTALGDGITWAVMDTGIDALHPHFKLHANIDVVSPYHADFTGAPGGPKPLQDDHGHGTHVSGIIAGGQSVKEDSDPAKMKAVRREIDADGKTVTRTQSTLDAISGMAPKCKLVSLKVLDEFGMGLASNVIAAIAYVQLLNGHGRDLKIHGVNLSLGHKFDPKWFACGHSPLCVEVNRLVKSGVVVVVAAGNTGYGTLKTAEGSADIGLEMTINDPGNAEHAITVGSTHREMPHMYGVSYFSSKGPTGDGRYKPDLLAPGENILSCAAAKSTLVERETQGADCSYFETSGTSMAAPHVSGAIAAFLSIRSEFIGEAEKVKAIFTSTATDLGRDRYFQGAGLVDLMRAIQSV
jgi:serine protease AprX